MAYAPLLFEVRFEFVFFNIRATCEREIESTNFNSIVCSLSKLKVHRPLPFGAFVHASAVILARCSGLNFCGLPLRGLEKSATSSPSDLYMFLTLVMLVSAYPNWR